MVVPPGEETMSLSVAGVPPLSARSRTRPAEPRTVCAATRTASGFGSPWLTAALARASMKLNVKAGPDPARAVNSEKCFSGSSIAWPTAVKSSTTRATWSSVARALPHTAAMPWPIIALTFGITRITARPGGSSSSMRAIVWPAAIETTTGRLSANTSRSSPTTAGSTCGLTARTTKSHVSTTSWFEAATRTPSSAARRSPAAGSTSVTTMSVGEEPAATAPRTIAPAMLPAPMKPKEVMGPC